MRQEPSLLCCVSGTSTTNGSKHRVVQPPLTCEMKSTTFWLPHVFMMCSVVVGVVVSLYTSASSAIVAALGATWNGARPSMGYVTLVLVVVNVC